MTSPVDTSVKHFLHTMSGAPVLNGTAGSLVALLDAVLVTGFDTKSLTSLVVASGVATASFTGTHSSTVDSVVVIAGVTGGPSGFAGLNGEQKITGRPNATSATFATTLPDGTYTGSITMKMAPAGWSKPFSGTNKAVFRSVDVQAHSGGMFLRVDDAAATTARVTGYEAMTEVDTGTGPFPTTAQINGGGYWPKSINANATAVGYAVVADPRFFFIHVMPAMSGNVGFQIGTTRGFGDLISRRPSGDAFAVGLNYSTNAGASSQLDASFDHQRATTQTALARAHSGLGSSVLHACPPYIGGSSSMSGQDNWLGPGPSEITGELFLSRAYIAVAVSQPPRADVPGLLSIPQSAVADKIKFGDRVPGSGAMVGRNLLAVNGAISGFSSAAGSGAAGVTLFDITGPWR